MAQATYMSVKSSTMLVMLDNEQYKNNTIKR